MRALRADRARQIRGAATRAAARTRTLRFTGGLESLHSGVESQERSPWCDTNAHSLTFSPDRSEMILRYQKPTVMFDGSITDTTRYEVIRQRCGYCPVEIAAREGEQIGELT